MRQGMLGLLVGVALTLLVGYAAGWFDGAPGAPPENHGNAVARPEPETAEPPAVVTVPEPPRLEGRKGTEPQPFAPGEVWLTIGDGYVLGEAAVRRGEDRDRYDLYCQDIRYGASLACPHGAMEPHAPLSAVGMPSDPADTARLLRDAPAVLSGRNLWVRQASTREQSGIGAIRGRDGKVYRIHLATLEPHPEALQRRVLLRYAEIPTREGGGELHLPTTDKGKPVPIEMRPTIRKALSYQGKLRGASFINHLQGAYEVVTGLPAETTLTQERFLLVNEPLRTKVVLPRRGGVFAARGIDAGGHVVIDSYAGVGSAGDMAGVVDVESYGYVYIDGDLVGTVNIKSYATVIIEGDIRGTLKIRSYTSLLLRGRVLGKLDAHGSCWSTFYLDGYWTQADLEELGRDFGSVTLHVRDSDLAPGKHKEVGTWREVIVADDVWKKL